MLPQDSFFELQISHDTCVMAAGAPPLTQLRVTTVLPKPPRWIWGQEFDRKEGKGDWKGEERGRGG